MVKVLISDKMSELALETFQSWGLGVDYEPGLSPENLLARIGTPVADLVAGTWRLSAKWYTTPVLEERTVEIQERTVVEVRLPEEAVKGQDEEAWRRADWMGVTRPRTELLNEQLRWMKGLPVRIQPSLLPTLRPGSMNRPLPPPDARLSFNRVMRTAMPS